MILIHEQNQAFSSIVLQLQPRLEASRVLSRGGGGKSRVQRNDVVLRRSNADVTTDRALALRTNPAAQNTERDGQGVDRVQR